MHYYREMSALGDIPQSDYSSLDSGSFSGKIQTVSIPFCVVHAMGWLPFAHKWEWMSDVAMSFVHAVDDDHQAKQATAASQEARV
jgi:hypothetical protein